MRKLEERFDGLQMEHIPRAENDVADGLSKRAALKLPVEPGTFLPTASGSSAGKYLPEVNFLFLPCPTGGVTDG